MRRLVGLVERAVERGPEYGGFVNDVFDAAERAENEFGQYEEQLGTLLQHFNFHTLSKDLHLVVEALNDLRVSASALKEDGGDAYLDERQMTPAMQRTLDKTVKELERSIGPKAAQELMRKYAEREPEKGA